MPAHTPRAFAARLAVAAALAVGALALPAAAAEPARVHALAMHGTPALPEGFERYPWVEPDAPRGGRLTLALQGTFDSLNPFVVLGVAPDLAPRFVLESLMTRAQDEPFTVYPLLAEALTIPEDRTFVVFHLDPRARFSDGEPVTSEDVKLSFELLREKGKPFHRTNFGKVTAVTVLDERTIRFDLGDGSDRELPLIIATMPVFAAHAVDPATFDKTTLDPILGSGPYRFGTISPGERVTVVRRDDYWGEDLPTRRGLFNFAEIRYEFFRDANTMFEAFKTGAYDLRVETDATRWATGYDFPALREGRIVKEEVELRTPQGMSGFVFNTRRPMFADARVREALGLLFDADWVNRNLFFGLLQRSNSYFANSDLSAAGRPADERERALLGPYLDRVRPDVLEGTWTPPATDGSGRDRAAIRQAVAMLAEAGFRLEGGVMRNAATGEPFAFEFLASSREQERLALNFAQSLQRIGVAMSVRLVDDAQYWRRLAAFEFDMIQWVWRVSLSPGNEQTNRWSAGAAGREGSLNYAGASEPAIDAMIAALLAATDREDFVAAVRALDRLLLSGFYVVPLFSQTKSWIAYDARLRRPETTPLLGVAVAESWWRESQ